jgi:hypothetical protein
LAALHRAVPLIGARLRGDVWHPGPPPGVARVVDDPVRAPGLLRRFNLAEEPPLRVVFAEGGARIALGGHHAAFDGRALAALLAALLGGALPEPAEIRATARAAPRPRALRRLLSRADRVAPSRPPPTGESFAVRRVDLSGRSVTAGLAAACAGAVGDRNRALGHRWSRIGVSIGVGGPAGVGNQATYRRIDVRAGADVAEAVRCALAASAEPLELVRTPRWARLLAPIAPLFSDTFLVSNLGRLDVEGLRAAEFFPVARGASAVAFGAVGLPAGGGTVSIRARDLSQQDADQLIDDVLRRLDGR